MPPTKQRKTRTEPTDETTIISDNPPTAREKFEQGRLSRRAALRKMGLTTGMALFGMFAVDDLARIAIKRMEQHKETQQVAETVAKEFKNSGIAFAGDSGSSVTLSRACSDCFQNSDDGSDKCGDLPAGTGRDDCNTKNNNALKKCLKDNKCPTD